MKLTLEGQEAMLYFLDPGESICGNYLESREICLFSPLVYLSNHLLTVWIHGCLSYALVYNPILLYLFYCLKFSIFGHWELFFIDFWAPGSL